ncbi:MAG: DUF1109 family protein [Reyranella sp.]|uniref:NrsF family protein n=1 Tax=Reyranella sp. TaxID=1929291 RepID=UPI00120AA646|nr:NrsF family protein [Reyranella sp.]TAJ87808.1 MAG: DUF1109 family protein [Reyranella sp.]
MKTEQLVASLVADRAGSARPLGRSMGRAVLAGALVSLVIFAVEFGPRVDLSAAFATWRFDLKLVLVLAALVAASGACIAMARPVATARWQWAVLPVLLIAAAALGTELAVLPAETWEARLVGSNALVCLTAIPVFALAPLAMLLLALRRSAPASPALAGAAAGALAAAAAAAIYAFHCFDDSPLFVLTWYPLAAIPVILVGAAVGHRLLRW